MKKAIIVGSNKGYGASISKVLHNNGFYTIGLSRKENVKGTIDEASTITDVSDIALFSEEFKVVLDKNIDINTAVFVTGDVVLKPQAAHTNNDFQYTLDVNLRYVVEAVKQLKEKSEVKNIITFGSQWSYIENEKILASYSIAKHLLKRFTRLLNEQGINAFHFCVPTSKTEKALAIGSYLRESAQTLPLEESQWAEPDEISQIIVDELLKSNPTNGLYRFDRDRNTHWSLVKIDSGTDIIDQKIAELQIEDFFDGQVLYKLAKEIYMDLVKKELIEDQEFTLEFKPKFK